MNIEHGSGPIMAFTDRAGPDDAVAPPSKDAVEYCRKRERAERAAAKKSPSVLARRVHQELAEAYAQMTRKAPRP